MPHCSITLGLPKLQQLLLQLGSIPSQASALLARFSPRHSLPAGRAWLGLHTTGAMKALRTAANSDLGFIHHRPWKLAQGQAQASAESYTVHQKPDQSSQAWDAPQSFSLLSTTQMPDVNPSPLRTLSLLLSGKSHPCN